MSDQPPHDMFDGSIQDQFLNNLIWFHEHQSELSAADRTDKLARAVLDTWNDLDVDNATLSQILAFNKAVAEYKASRHTLDQARQWCAGNFDLLYTEAVLKSPYAFDVLAEYVVDRKQQPDRNSRFVKKFNQYMQAREARCHV